MISNIDADEDYRGELSFLHVLRKSNLFGKRRARLPTTDGNGDI